MANLRTRAAGALAVMGVAVALAGCAPAVELPSEEPDAVGIAMGVVPSGEETVAFTLTGGTNGDYFYNASITVGPDTVVGDASGNPVDPMELTSGMQVSVWADLCAESYPVQCVATAVRVDAP